jgi:DNA-binding transcriptional regulator YiaG
VGWCSSNNNGCNSTCRKALTLWSFGQVDVKAPRKKLAMTQEQFAVTFGFSLPALRHWERGDRTPERSARILLKVIEFSPETVLKATHATSQIHLT